MPARVITRCPTKSNRTPVLIEAKVPGKKGLVAFKLIVYAQDAVQAEKARDFIPGLKELTIKIGKRI